MQFSHLCCTKLVMTQIELFTHRKLNIRHLFISLNHVLSQLNKRISHFSYHVPKITKKNVDTEKKKRLWNLKNHESGEWLNSNHYICFVLYINFEHQQINHWFYAYTETSYFYIFGRLNFERHYDEFVLNENFIYGVVN